MNRIEIEIYEYDGVTGLVLVGRLDESTAPALSDEISRLLGTGVTKFVIDLARLDFMSSAGLGIFVGAAQSVREKKGDIKLARPTAFVQRLLGVMGFDDLFQVFDSSESAVAAFRGSAR